jgi:uncharacterized protein YbcC (UPF0753/DUF2309 family)
MTYWVMLQITISSMVGMPAIFDYGSYKTQAECEQQYDSYLQRPGASMKIDEISKQKYIEVNLLNVPDFNAMIYYQCTHIATTKFVK